MSLSEYQIEILTRLHDGEYASEYRKGHSTRYMFYGFTNIRKPTILKLLELGYVERITHKYGVRIEITELGERVINND